MPLTEQQIATWEAEINFSRKVASRLNNLAAKAEDFITNIDQLEVDLALTQQQINFLKNKIIAERDAIRADLLAFLT